MAARPKCKCRDGKECRPCYLLRTDHRYATLWNEPAAESTQLPEGGPGTELKSLLSSLGFQGKQCGCDGRASLMDAWGVERCIEKREQIIEWLKQQQKQSSWSSIFGAALRSVPTGLVGKINPLDPVPGLVDEAIRRASLAREGRSKETASDT